MTRTLSGGGRRTSAVAAALAFMSLGLAACSSDSSGSDSGTTELTWYMWSSSEAEVDAWNHVGDLVTERYPDITMSFETASWADYWTRLATQAGSSSGPCIVGVQSLRVTGVADLLQPLGDVLPDDVDLGDFDPSILDAMTVDGQQLALPYDFGPLVVYYNRDAFADAGLAEPEPDWTVDDFTAAARTLTSGDRYGFAAFPNIDYFLPWAVNMTGKQAVDASGELNLTDPDFVEAFQWYADLVGTEGVAAEVPATSNSSALDQFLAGNAAMTVDGPWNLINAQSTAGFDVGIAPVPAGEAGQTSVTSGSGFGITQGCSDAEAAARALSVITGPEAGEYLASSGRAYSARTAQQQSWYDNAVEGAQETLEAAAASAEAERTTADWTSVVSAFQQYGTQAINGETSAEEFLNTVAEQAGS
ncbi:ABC transporter substrate-binding protein [Streptomyces sp. PT12]|uniref:ABC transporter substrate-binding protein n=1 Tax=Streptomyces sp. PT12 TaxID=1510197 RepID=UPI000DE38233|nr:sugar ABC transporter substrate-binding protein [Streptomyces sp. PT12]RBM06250.1 sugar ABC transporter substrate-binding protein [Streptomyces sp. PT12]